MPRLHGGDHLAAAVTLLLKQQDGPSPKRGREPTPRSRSPRQRSPRQGSPGSVAPAAPTEGGDRGCAPGERPATRDSSGGAPEPQFTSYTDANWSTSAGRCARCTAAGPAWPQTRPADAEPTGAMWPRSRRDSGLSPGAEPRPRCPLDWWALDCGALTRGEYGAAMRVNRISDQSRRRRHGRRPFLLHRFLRSGRRPSTWAGWSTSTCRATTPFVQLVTGNADGRRGLAHPLVAHESQVTACAAIVTQLPGEWDRTRFFSGPSGDVDDRRTRVKRPTRSATDTQVRDSAAAVASLVTS